jgi:hypothetical protein
MSTRCNIIIKDQYEKLIFYRHSDGYPSVTLNSLCQFMQWIKEDRIRNNVEQCAGWLILLGAKEYSTEYKKNEKTGEYENIEKTDLFAPGNDINISGWKAGAYEPSTSIHGDIEYLYTLTIDKKPQILVESVNHSRKIVSGNVPEYTMHKKKLGIITDFYKEYDDNLEEVHNVTN